MRFLNPSGDDFGEVETARLRVSMEEVGDAIVFVFEGEFLDSDVRLVRDGICDFLRNRRRLKVILDFSSLAYITSLACGSLFKIYQLNKDNGGDMASVEPEQETARNVISVTQLSQVLKAQKSREEAVSELSN